MNKQATSRHTVSKSAPAEYRVPEGIPKMPKFHTILADPPWSKNQQGSGRYGGAINHYNLMSLERIKEMPVADLAADDAHLYLWVTNGNMDEGLEVMKAWGFRYITNIPWIKFTLGMGNYFRNATETCLFGVRGHLPPKARNVNNWLLANPTVHSEKPREFIPAKVEKVSEGPYLELFCRKRPASHEQWYCWGDETEGGADIFIPGYPVPKYSFEVDNGQPQPDAPGEEAIEDTLSGDFDSVLYQTNSVIDQPTPTTDITMDTVDHDNPFDHHTYPSNQPSGDAVFAKVQQPDVKEAQ